MLGSAHDGTAAALRAISLVLVAVAALCGPVPALAQTRSARTVEQPVIGADDDDVRAELGHDEALIRRRIDDRFVHNDADGTTIDKGGIRQRVVRLPMVGQTIRDGRRSSKATPASCSRRPTLRLAPPGAAEQAVSLRYTCTDIRRDGVWRMLTLQMQTRTS